MTNPFFLSVISSGEPAPAFEIGARRAGTERRDRDARAGALVRESLGERKDVGLRRVVDGHDRPGLESGRGGDVQDAPPATLPHPGQEELRQVGQGDDVDLNHLELALERSLGEEAVDAEARVVHEDVDRDAALRELAPELGGRGGVAEIRREDRDAHAVLLGEAPADRLEAFALAGDEDDVVPVLRGERGELETDSARGARDEGRRHARIPRPEGPSPYLASALRGSAAAGAVSGFAIGRGFTT